MDGMGRMATRYTECSHPQPTSRASPPGALTLFMLALLQLNLKGEKMKQEQIAKVCHQINKAYCEALGDFSQPEWDDAPEWQRESARMGVDLHTMGDFGPEASHISWMKQKVGDGWVYGEIKDTVEKTHPCIVPFGQLPKEQQAKDFIFRAVVHELKDI